MHINGMNPQLSEDTNASHSQSPWKDFLIVTSQMVILVKVDLVVRVSFIYGISYKLQLPLYYFSSLPLLFRGYILLGDSVLVALIILTVTKLFLEAELFKVMKT